MSFVVIDWRIFACASLTGPWTYVRYFARLWLATLFKTKLTLFFCFARFLLSSYYRLTLLSLIPIYLMQYYCLYMLRAKVLSNYCPITKGFFVRVHIHASSTCKFAWKITFFIVELILNSLENNLVTMNIVFLNVVQISFLSWGITRKQISKRWH